MQSNFLYRNRSITLKPSSGMKRVWTNAFCISLMFALVSALLFFANSLAHAQSEAPPDRFAYSANFDTKEKGFSAILRFNAKPEYRVFLMDNPWRVVIELNDASFRLPKETRNFQNEFIRSVRFGAVSQSKSRLVLTLAKPSSVVANKLTKAEGSDRHTLSFSIEPVSAQLFAAKVKEQQVLLGTSGEVVVKGGRVRAGPRKSGTFSIVIDPGHGGIDGGSTGVKTGILEKHIVLAMAKKIGAVIAKSKRFEVSYTREEDVFVSLRERQKFARRQNADLLLSIHADSLRQRFVRGATVYTLAKKATDALSQQIADSENLADLVAGLAAPEAQDDVTDILADLTLRETTRFSHQFSNVLVSNLNNSIRMIKNPQRAASFAVLKNAEIPGILMELGYLSNSEDEKLLSNEAWQEKVAVMVADSVKDFFANRTPNAKAN